MTIATSSGQRCPSRHVGNWERGVRGTCRHVDARDTTGYLSLGLDWSILASSFENLTLHRVLPSSMFCLAVSRTDAFSSSTLLFPLSSFRLHAYASRILRSLTNLIYERRRLTKDVPDESIHPKPIQRDRGLFIVTACNELYSRTPSVLRLMNGYKLMIRWYQFLYAFFS